MGKTEKDFEVVEILFSLPLKIYAKHKNGFLEFQRLTLPKSSSIRRAITIECPSGSIFLTFRKIEAFEVPENYVALDTQDYWIASEKPPLTRKYQFTNYCEAIVFFESFRFLSEHYKNNSVFSREF